MKLSQLDRAIAVRNYRKHLKTMLASAKEGAIEIRFPILDKDLASQVPLDPVREFIVRYIERHIAVYEGELLGMGVDPTEE